MMGVFYVYPKNAHFRDQQSPFLGAQVSLAECHAEVAVWTTAKTTKSGYPTLHENKTQLVQEQLDLQDQGSLWFHFKPTRFREIIPPLFMLHLPWDIWRIRVLEQFIWQFSPRNRLLEAKHQCSHRQVCLPPALGKWALLLLLLSWAKWSFRLITTAGCCCQLQQHQSPAIFAFERFFCCLQWLGETQPFFIHFLVPHPWGRHIQCYLQLSFQPFFLV